MERRENKRFLEFEEFRIDVEERQLFHRGERLAVTPKDFDLLLVLIENCGRTVSKDDLMEMVWQNTYVYEGNLNRHISTLRKLLREQCSSTALITTIPKRGYRFDGDVREIFETETVTDHNAQYRIAFHEVTTSTSASRFSFSPSPTLIAVMLVVVLTAAAFWLFVPSERIGVVAAFRPSVEEHGTTDPVALELYEDGRRLWASRNVEDLHNATLKLEQAVAIDGQFARAHAALADAYAFDHFNWTKAERSAVTALEIDPNLVEPYATLGFIETFWRWNPKAAEENFKRAIAVDPGYATAHQWYGISLAARGRTGLALAEMRRAVEIDPSSPAINADLCQLLYFSRRYDEAIEQCRKTLEIDPVNPNAHRYLYDIYTVSGRHQDAVARYFVMEELRIVRNASTRESDELRIAFYDSGIRSFWQRRADLLKRDKTSSYRIAQYYSLLGDGRMAMAYLRDASDRRELDCIFISVDPIFAELGSDSEFRSMASHLIDQES